jgi:hypothetical protein
MDTTKLEHLLNRYVDGALQADEKRELEQMLLASAEVRELFWRQVQLHGMIRNCYETRSGQHLANSTNRPFDEAPDPMHAPRGANPSVDLRVPIRVETKAATNGPVSPILGPLGSAWHGAVGYVSSGWPVAYLVATVIFAVGLLLGSLMIVPAPVQVARQSTRLSHSTIELNKEHVGQITGMVDCQWANESMAAFNGAHVPRGRKYALISGLMEITYNTGAKVILQGPVTYEVESAVSGFLSVGKLTAKVDKDKRSAIVNQKSETSTPQSLIPNPSLSTAHYPLFTIKTPTAVVTDLGTEFGVEVGRQGQTTSHVFRGSVKLQLVGDDSEAEGDAIVLRENETVQTEKSDKAGGPAVTVRRISANPAPFVRQMIQPPKFIDLLDIVAGGNGTGQHRERGIDPSSGMEDPLFVAAVRDADPQYRPITWSALIDGVFVPKGGAGPTVLDSAGHTFDGFQKTDGKAYGSIWPRSANVKPNKRNENPNYWVHFLGRCDQYMPERRGLLGLHANAGITFNLAAMRDRYPGVRPVRLRAVAGVAEAPGRHSPDEGTADIYVFVDGKVKLEQMQFRPGQSAFAVDVEIGADDRFLTLVATDGGEGCSCNWVVFGDARLEVRPNTENGAK